MGGAVFWYGYEDIISTIRGVAGGDATLICMGCVVGKTWVDGCADKQ